MRKLLIFAVFFIVGGYAHAIERGGGVVGSMGQTQLFRSSFSLTAHLGMLGSTGTHRQNPFLSCVAIKGFRVTNSTGSPEVQIGFYNAYSTATALSAGQFVSSYTLTTDHQADFDGFFSSGGVYNVVATNAGVTIPTFAILWDYLSPSCIPIHLR